MPEETAEFDKIINNIEPFGGGDEEEDGLEALGIAIGSKWNNHQNMRKRHIIILWTDAAPHDLGFGKEGIKYPKEMAGSFDELTRWWMNEDKISQKGKRLLLFAPQKSWWGEIMYRWDNVISYKVEEGSGIKEIDYNQILNAIASSI